MKRSMWNVGDILIYKIRSDNLMETFQNNELIGKYVLFEVTGLTRVNIGYLPQDEFYHEFPVLTLYDWIGDDIPSRESISRMNFRKRQNLDDLTMANYLPDTFENGVFKWKKKDFDTIQYVYTGSKKTSIQLEILIPSSNPEYIEVSYVGRPWIDKNINNVIICEFSNRAN